MAKKRVMVTLDESLLARMDEYDQDHELTRSGLISLAVKDYMDSQALLPDFSAALSRLSDVIADNVKKGQEDEAVGGD